MATTALVRLTNTTTTSYTFEVELSKPIKFVNRVVLPASGYADIEVEAIIPMVLFDTSFQTALAAGTVTISYTSGGSTVANYLSNILRFLSASSANWQTP